MISNTVSFKEKCYECDKKVSLSLLSWAEQKDAITERNPRCPSCWTKYTPPAAQELPEEIDLEPILELMGVTSVEELFA